MRDVLNPKSFFTLKRKMSHEICDSTSWSVNKNQRIGESRIHKTRAILNYNIQIIIPNNLFPLPKQSDKKNSDLWVFFSLIYSVQFFYFYLTWTLELNTNTQISTKPTPNPSTQHHQQPHHLWLCVCAFCLVFWGWCFQ